MKTRNLLIQSTLQLVLEKGSDAISIQDITERADLGRGTFYIHFKDKEEVVWTAFRNLFQDLEQEKGKLESSGCLGGGNDHFMAVLNSGPDTDTGQAVVDFYKTPLSGLTAKMIEEGWVKNMPIIMALLQDIGVEFVRDEHGGWLRTVGFGQPGNWWVHIKNGMTIKKRLAKKVRDVGVQVMDHVMVTLLLKGNGKVMGCVGFNVLEGTFHVFGAKKVVSPGQHCLTRMG